MPLIELAILSHARAIAERLNELSATYLPGEGYDGSRHLRTKGIGHIFPYASAITILNTNAYTNVFTTTAIVTVTAVTGILPRQVSPIERHAESRLPATPSSAVLTQPNP